MWDGSAMVLAENLASAAELLNGCAAAGIVLKLEIGVIGGEEEDIVGEIDERLYTTPDDALQTAEVLGTGENGAYLLAATFGNVHGIYKPGRVELRRRSSRTSRTRSAPRSAHNDPWTSSPRWLRLEPRRHPREPHPRRGEDEH